MSPTSAPLSAPPPCRRRALASLLALLGCLSCGAPTDDLSEKVARFARLSGAKESPTPGLADAVRQIEAAGEGPQQLVRPPATDGNAATALAKALDDATRLELLPQLEELAWPAGGEYSARQVALARELLAKRGALLDEVTDAGRAPRCEFDVRHDLGYFGKLAFLDDVAVAARLHMLAALVALRDDQGPAACDHLESAARWLGSLAEERRIEARLLAAQLRGEWLRVVSEAVTRPATLAEAQRLYAVLAGWLRAWPPDRRALVGDRAVTLHAYEAIRAGMLENILTTEEQHSLGDQGVLSAMRAMDDAAIDSDELAYLRAMETIIASSDQPLFQRADGLRTLFDRFEPGGEGARAAPLAAHLFLKDLPRALERMARDRARCEAWAIAIAAAAGFDMPPYAANPVNGDDYQVHRQTSALRVIAGDGEMIDPFVPRPVDGLSGERGRL